MGDLDSCVGGDYVGDPRIDQQQGFAVVAAAHQGDGFALKASDLAIWEDRLEAVSDFNAGTAVSGGVEDQDSTVGRLRSDSPLVKKIDGVALDVSPIECVDGDYGDLGVGFVVDLLADVFHLRCCGLIDNVCEVVDVAGGFEFFDGLGVDADREQKKDRCAAYFRARNHR